MEDRNARILIVDDEEAARYGILRALSAPEYEITEAPNGVSALKLTETFKPDVIVSDINMPGLDGLSLLRHVREQPDAPLVILVTAYGSEERVVEALRAGAYDYVAKPFEVSELRLVVRNAVERQRLSAQNRRYRDAMAQTERLSTLGRLVAGIAHEMNNPLGALLSGVDTLERVVRKVARADADPALLSMAGTAAAGAREAGSRLSRVVRNLKRFARIDESESGQTRIADSIGDTLALLEREFEGVRMERDVDSSAVVEGSTSEWSDVFLNLLLNARDAIAATGTEGRIGVRVHTDGGDAVIQVEDNGAGIAADELPRIFDPGFTTKGVRVGTGLGLPICYRVVEAHGGTIQVESREGEGSRFTLRVPLAKDHD